MALPYLALTKGKKLATLGPYYWLPDKLSSMPMVRNEKITPKPCMITLLSSWGSHIMIALDTKSKVAAMISAILMNYITLGWLMPLDTLCLILFLFGLSPSIIQCFNVFWFNLI